MQMGAFKTRGSQTRSGNEKLSINWHKLEEGQDCSREVKLEKHKGTRNKDRKQGRIREGRTSDRCS